MIGDLIGSLGEALAALAAIVVAAGAIWAKGRSAGRSEAVAKRGEEYRKTVERAKDADLSAGDDDADRDWLRKRGQ